MYSCTVPKGSYLLFNSASTHKNSECWPLEMTENMPMEEFIPERWESYTKGHHHTSEIPLIYTPFGSGPRKCIGERFAIYESIIVLSRLVNTFEIDFAPSSPLKTRDIDTECVITMRPIGPVELEFTKRETNLLKK